jgi:hypothetical protein
MRNPSWELRSLLLAKDPSVKTNSFDRARFKGTYFRPLSLLSICHLIRALRS